MTLSVPTLRFSPFVSQCRFLSPPYNLVRLFPCLTLVILRYWVFQGSYTINIRKPKNKKIENKKNALKRTKTTKIKCKDDLKYQIIKKVKNFDYFVVEYIKYVISP